MDPVAFQTEYLKVAEKIKQGLEISRQDRIILLLAQLLGRETRQESHYGHR